ncbi:hypothetical protein AURDEDRAFT_128050 [Auricularia subglabra TFB-10046 SS5]|nr:hypothetical protein AURDEDRAFT_128050 [Auricularia subglabra TFB-10046 SS5]
MVRLAVLSSLAMLFAVTLAAPLNGTTFDLDDDAFLADEGAHTLEARAPKHKGSATWFNPGLGSCGQYDNDNSYVVALTPALMANKKARCGKKIRIRYGKKSVVAVVRDTCPGCAAKSKWAIDMSPATFKKLAGLGRGRITVSWEFIKNGKPGKA